MPLGQLLRCHNGGRSESAQLQARNHRHSHHARGRLRWGNGRAAVDHLIRGTIAILDDQREAHTATDGDTYSRASPLPPTPVPATPPAQPVTLPPAGSPALVIRKGDASRKIVA